MRCFKLLLFIGLSIALAAVPAFAQDDAAKKAKGPAEYTLGEIIVKDSTSALERSTTVTEVTAQELKDSGARTLADAFKLIPGITTRTAADGTCRIDIRGMRTRNVKLLINGIPFESTLDGQFDPETIPVENIARIKITRGAASVLYGNGGTAGVIDIITRKGAKGITGTAGVMAGQGDLYKIKSTIAGGDGKLDYYAGGSYLTRNGYPISSNMDKTIYQDADLRKNSDRKHFNFLSNLTYAATDKTSFGGTINVFKGANGKPPAVVKDGYTTEKYIRVTDYQGLDLQLAMNHDFSGPLDTRLMLYTSVEDLTEDRYDNAYYNTQTKKNSYRSKATSTTVGLNNQWGYDTDYLGRFKLALIGESQHWRETGFTLPANNTPKDLDVNRTLRSYSGALQDDITLFEKLQLSFGAGLNGQSRTEKNTTTYTYVVAGNYQFTEGTKLKLSHARKVRFPSIDNYYSTKSGNPNLKHETTWHYEAGLTQALPLATTAGFTVFRIDAKDFIEKDGAGISQNYDDYRFQGMEFTLDSAPLDSLTTKLGYTYMDSQNLSDTATDSALQYRPRHKITAQATYVAPTDTTIFASIRYFADQWTFNKAGTAKMRMPGYSVVDMKVSQAFTDALSVYVGADNLLDKNYSESYGYTRPGRVVYTGLDYTF